MKTTLEMKMTLKFKTSPKMKTAQKMKKILKGKMTLNMDTNEWQALKLAGGTVKGYFSPYHIRQTANRAYTGSTILA